MWIDERESREEGEEVGLMRTVGGGEEMEWRVERAERRGDDGVGDCWRITMRSEGANCWAFAFSRRVERSTLRMVSVRWGGRRVR